MDNGQGGRGEAKRRINLSVVGMSGIIEMAGNILADYMALDPDVELKSMSLPILRI